MTKRLLICLLIVVTVFSGVFASAETWRSELYPTYWASGLQDSVGRFLHDFSYAGYKTGLTELPETIEGKYIDVTQEPYFADNTGTQDATDAIQAAIDAVGQAGGGTVYMPAGTYKLSLREERECALLVGYSNVLLKGAGVGETKLYCDTYKMREVQIIVVGQRRGSWDTSADGTVYPLSKDVPETPVKKIFLQSVSGLNVGDWVAVTSDWTKEYIKEMGMQSMWAESDIYGPRIYRKITAVDTQNGSVTLDAPTRCAMLMRDNTRLYKINPSVSGSGLADFSIGNREYPIKSAATDLDAYAYQTKGTAGYNVHASDVIRFSLCVDSWMQNVSTYRPECNDRDVHMLSNGLEIMHCRGITVRNCSFSNAQYQGAGGNGYGYIISAGDCLLDTCSAISTRHGFSFKYAWSNGNVLYNCLSRGSWGGSDFHMMLSMANLVDNLTLDKDFIEAVVRPYGGAAGRIHGHTTTQTVFWNTHGESYFDGKRYIIDSRQYGWGYIIGTDGKADKVNTLPTAETEGGYGKVDTSPEDHVEGVGKGDTLDPQSLYQDQLRRRKFSGG